jgi:uncharacterized integral membrane protein
VKYLSWLLKAAIFFTVFAFALNNQGDVRLHLFFGAYWDAPLVLVVLVALGIGVFMGIGVMVPPWLKARRAAQSRQQAAEAAQPAAQGEAPPHGI